MAQVAFEKNIGGEWIDVTTLATLTEGETYYIQNRGAGVLVAQENNSEPTDEQGIVVMPYKVLKYTNNGKCWVKSLSGLCTINITDENAPAPAPDPIPDIFIPNNYTDGMTVESIEGGRLYSFTKDGYEASFAWMDDLWYEGEIIPIENVTVKKDGQIAGTSTMTVAIYDESGNEIKRADYDSLFGEASSDSSENISFGTDMQTDYSFGLAIETDEETELSFFVYSSLKYNGENFNGSVRFFIQTEE